VVALGAFEVFLAYICRAFGFEVTIWGFLKVLWRFWRSELGVLMGVPTHQTMSWNTH